MEVRLLSKDEIPLVRELFRNNEVLREPEEIAIIGAFEDGKLIGIRSVNFLIHTLTVVDKEFRHKGIGHMLMDYLCREYNGEFYAIPTNSFAVRMCEKAGLTEVKGVRVFKREAK